jgi:hypothetical protein
MTSDKILKELKEHAPFTFFATLIAVFLIVIIKFYFLKDIPESWFHIMHPGHVFVSALVSAAIFYKYKKNIFYSLIIGISISVIIGSTSDILIPWLGGIIFNLETSFHLPLIEETFLIISTALLGSILGIITKISKEPHFLHVFISVFASLFYLTSFSHNLSYIEFILMILIVFVAVLIPCCMSDIVFPVLLSKTKHSHHKNSHSHKNSKNNKKKKK